MTNADQEDISAAAEILMERGLDRAVPPFVRRRRVEARHMRELRVQWSGRPIRVFYAFDPTRSAILLIGGNKSGDKRFYKKTIPSPTASMTSTSHR